MSEKKHLANRLALDKEPDSNSVKLRSLIKLCIKFFRLAKGLCYNKRGLEWGSDHKCERISLYSDSDHKQGALVSTCVVEELWKFLDSDSA